MISTVIENINEAICSCFPNAKSFGVTSLLPHGESTIPCEIDKTGEGTPVVVSDAVKLLIYHRQIGIASTTVQGGSGNYGDANARFNNNFSMAMFVYWDRKNINLLQDEMFLNIQSALNMFLQDLSPFNSVRIFSTGANLNDNAVWNAEYTNNTDFRLPPASHFMQINYSIVADLRTDCFKCCDPVTVMRTRIQPSGFTISSGGSGGGGGNGGGGQENLFIQETEPDLGNDFLWIETNPDLSVKTFWVNNI